MKKQYFDLALVSQGRGLAVVRPTESTKFLFFMRRYRGNDDKIQPFMDFPSVPRLETTYSQANTCSRHNKEDVADTARDYPHLFLGITLHFVLEHHTNTKPKPRCLRLRFLPK